MRAHISIHGWKGAVSAWHHRSYSHLHLFAPGFQGITIYLDDGDFTDPAACADEIAAVIAKHRKADKPAEAV